MEATHVNDSSTKRGKVHSQPLFEKTYLLLKEFPTLLPSQAPFIYLSIFVFDQNKTLLDFEML